MTTLLSKPKMPEKSADQLAAEKHQADEIKRLKAEESQRKSALLRGKRGRASLLSGAETGIKETLG